MVKDGIADMGLATPGYTAGRFPLITAAGAPAALQDVAGRQPGRQSRLRQVLQGGVQGREGAWIWVHPPGQFDMAKKQVKVVEDLNGLKIRPLHHAHQHGEDPRRDPLSIPPTPTPPSSGERWTGPCLRGRRSRPSSSPKCCRHVSSGLYVSPLFTLMNQKVRQPSPDLRKVIDDLRNWGAEFTGGSRTNELGGSRRPEGRRDDLHRAARSASAGRPPSSPSRRSG